jgi:hypothetical protein
VVQHPPQRLGVQVLGHELAEGVKAGGTFGGEVYMAPEEDMRFGYVRIATTDDRIYALFSGRSNRGSPRDAPYGRFVHVYDWDGEFLAALELDNAALEIAVDPLGEELYATIEEPEPGVRVYSLRELDLL